MPLWEFTKLELCEPRETKKEAISKLSSAALEINNNLDEKRNSWLKIIYLLSISLSARRQSFCSSTQGLKSSCVGAST